MEAGTVLEGRSGPKRSHSRRGRRPRGHAPSSPAACRPSPLLPTRPQLTAREMGLGHRGPLGPRASGGRFPGPLARLAPAPPASPPASPPPRQAPPGGGPSALALPPIAGSRLRPRPSRYGTPPRLLPGPRASAPPAAPRSFQLLSSRVSSRAGCFPFPGPGPNTVPLRRGGRRKEGGAASVGAAGPFGGAEPPEQEPAGGRSRTRAASGPGDSPAPRWPPPPLAPGSRTSTSSSKSSESKRGAGEAGRVLSAGTSPTRRPAPLRPRLASAPEPAVPEPAVPQP